MSKLVALVVSTLAFVVALTYADDTLTLDVDIYYPYENFNYFGYEPTLTLRGDSLGLSWYSSQSLDDSDAKTSGLWTTQLTYTTADIGSVVSMKVMVDDEVWQIGANSQVRLADTSCKATIYPWFFTFEGTYDVIEDIFSPELNNTRDMVVYYPPSYRENMYKTYSNVLIMQDGQNICNASTSALGIAWDIQDTLNVLIVEGVIEEVFVLGPYNAYAARTWEYTYSYDSYYQMGGGGDIYLDFLEDTLIPLSAKLLPRIDVSTRDNIGILGSSLGGLISCYAAYTRPNVYAKAGCMSTSFWWNNQDFNGTVMVDNPAPVVSTTDMEEIELYIDSGNAGPGEDDYAETLTVLHHAESLGFHINETIFYYLDKGGEHNEYYWGERFWVPMTYLYPVEPVTAEALPSSMA